jgi:tetratricopeptide (TPR) repeat protein
MPIVSLAVVLEPTDAEEAERLFRQAVDIQKDAPNVSSYQQFRARHHGDLGRFLRVQGRPAEALPYLLEAIAINEKLAEQYPHLSVFRTRSEQLNRQVSDLRRSLGQISEARPANPVRQQALDLLKHLGAG